MKKLSFSIEAIVNLHLSSFSISIKGAVGIHGWVTNNWYAPTQPRRKKEKEKNKEEQADKRRGLKKKQKGQMKEKQSRISTYSNNLTQRWAEANPKVQIEKLHEALKEQQEG